MEAGTLRHRIRIEQPVAGAAFDDAGSGTWELVGEVFAEVQDVLPSRGERQVGGFNMAMRPARVRIRWRTDVTPAMRFKMGSRIMQIVSGPAELGRREGLEFMVEDYSSPGNPA